MIMSIQQNKKNQTHQKKKGGQKGVKGAGGNKTKNRNKIQKQTNKKTN